MVSSATSRGIGNGTLSQRARRGAPAAADHAEARRLAHLLAAAKATFVAKGFAATTMDNIAAAAGMSKKTLYKMFASKGDLFRAMLSATMSRRHRAELEPAATPRDRLRLALQAISDLALAPDEIALHRLVISERQQSPDFTRMFADVAFSLGSAGVIDCVKDLDLKPELRGLPPRQVAEMILGMVFASDHFRLMVDDRHRRNRKLIQQRIDLAIALVCAPEPAQP